MEPTAEVSQQTSVFLRSPGGAIWRETNPAEIARLKNEQGFEEVPSEIGEAAFAEKSRVVEKILRVLGDEMGTDQLNHLFPKQEE